MKLVDAIPHEKYVRKRRWSSDELGEEDDTPVLARKKSGKKPGRTSRWTKPLILGNAIRIQSRVGYRALSMELRPGLWIVAELKDPEGDNFGATTQDVQAVAKTALQTVDSALDTIFPARAAQKRQAAQAAADAKETRRLRRQLEAEQKRQQAARALPAPQQQRALPAPSPVNRHNARWAPDADDDDFDDDGEE